MMQRSLARLTSWIPVLAALALVCDAEAALDLRNATREQLPNGLTLIILEDRNFPVASVQMLYRVGARDETTGMTGLAHFLEHMAFRSSDSFPGTGLVSSIYNVGGEWHGYTWLDQTTYFATVPRNELDLLLRIEAERMTRLTLSEDDMEAERGAVLAEMHMYENDPATMLIDAVMFASFQAHPYRNNTIGWESDIQNLRHEDVVDFYRRHYHPGNAVLAVVGDVDAATVRDRVNELFGAIQARPVTPLPHTIEPTQYGERRVRLTGPADSAHFLIAWRAPAASSPDYAAFLVLQEFLAASSGASFLQNDWGTPAKPGSALDGTAGDVVTWFPPSAQDYVFTVGGAVDPTADQATIETEIERRLSTFREQLVDEERLSMAIDAVLEALVLDVTTTEDAAHQLAFFEGLGAYDVLMTLADRVRVTNAADVRRVASRYLQPEKRTIGWFEPGERPERESSESLQPAMVRSGPPAPVDNEAAPEPALFRTGRGVPVIVQPSDLSPTVYVQVQLPSGASTGSEAVSIDPLTGLPSLVGEAPSAKLDTLLRVLRSELAVPGQSARALSSDPETRLAQVFDRLMSGPTDPVQPAPVAIVISGDVEPAAAAALVEQIWGDVEPAGAGRIPGSGDYGSGDVTEHLGFSPAQSQLGYLVEAPPPAEADAFRVLLYILSHDYGGRLGDVAISEKGLAYWIDARYRSGGSDGWVSLGIGVDPGKLEALEEILDSELDRLASDPPSEREVSEAKGHFIGRILSASQSNEELASALARDYLWHGELRSKEQRIERWRSVTRDEVLAEIPAFGAGVRITVVE